MQDFGGHRAQQQLAERPVAVGGHHHQVDTVLVDEVHDSPGRIADFGHAVNFQAIEFLHESVLEIGLHAPQNQLGIDHRGTRESARIKGMGDTDEGYLCAMAASHVGDKRHRTVAALRKIDREYDVLDVGHGTLLFSLHKGLGNRVAIRENARPLRVYGDGGRPGRASGG